MRNQTKTAGTAKEITDFWYDPNGNQISSMTVSTGGTGTAGVGLHLLGLIIPTVTASTTVGISL